MQPRDVSRGDRPPTGQPLSDETVASEYARRTLIGRTGLIRHVKEVLRGAGEPRIYSVSCIPNDLTAYMDAGIEGHTGAVGFTRDEAFIGAVGECVERYCCAYYDWDALVFASKADLGDQAIGLDAFELYTERQLQHPHFPFAIWSPDQPIWWAVGQSLLTGERRYVPACLVYIPYRPKDRQPHDRQPSDQQATGKRPADRAKISDFLALSVSTGQACHSDVKRAVLTGLLEVIERDAFMITWVRQLGVPRLRYEHDAIVGEVYRRYFAGCGVTFHLFDIALDWTVPVILGVAEAQAERGRFICVGAAARLSERDAAIKALKEAAQGLIWGRDLVRRKPDWRPEPDFINVRDFEDHVRLFCEPDMLPHAGFLLDTSRERPVSPADPAGERIDDQLSYCLDQVRAKGLDAVVVDTTTREIAGLGFHAPKVFVPGTVPLTAVHGLPAYGPRRLYHVPPALGYTAPEHAAFNPIPHPFP